MIWVAVFGGIALLGLLGLVGYAVWLWHKAEDVLSEVDMVGRQAEEILSLLDGISPLEASRSMMGRAEVRDPDADRVPSAEVDLDFEPDYYPSFGARHVTERN